jgi:hypothetical protein
LDCISCKASLLPEDPSKPFFIRLGHYLPPICGSCPLQGSERLTEASEKTVHHIHHHSEMGKKDRDLLHQTANRLLNLEQKIQKMQVRRRERGKY